MGAPSILAFGSLDQFKQVAEILYYVLAGLAALGAFLVYRRNSRLERARWATVLYEKFYESDRYKSVRALVDSPPDSDQVTQLVISEEDKFTDYLNFFEYVAFLKESKQLRGTEVTALFGYFLDCFNRHERLQKYIENPDNGYEKLRVLLRSKK